MKKRYFKNCHRLSRPRNPLLILAPALLGLATLATPAAATPEIDSFASASAAVIDSGVLYERKGGSTQQLADGSYLSHKGCTSPSSNSSQLTGDCFFFDPNLVPAPTHWYQRPNIFTNAAAQVFTNFGVNKARVWSSGTNGSFAPGEENLQFAYAGEALSEYREEISYFGAASTLITLNLHLHAAWNHGGRFSLAIGEPIYDPDAAPLAAVIYDNCAPMVGSCAGRYGSPNRFYVAGNDAANINGMVDQFISVDMLLNAYGQDPENPNPSPINPFIVSLHTVARPAGAEFDAFNTVTLDSITVQPGVSLTFGSGTRYNVRVAGDPPPPPPPSNNVPEPAAPLLMLTGLAALLGTRRRTGKPPA